MSNAAVHQEQTASPGWLTTVFGGWAGVGKFLGIAAQFGLLTLVLQQFQLESPVFHEKIMPLAFFGFLVHYFLPYSFRLPFFSALSMLGIYLAFGVPDGLWLIGIGLLLLGICHLPGAFALRVGLLAAVGIGLVWLRVSPGELQWTAGVLPILASMFMFRVLIYLYDLKHQNEKPGFVRGIAYFFMLPNIVFPLFPVVDYSTFCQTYYDSDRHRIYQKGINLMVLGALQLIIYRYINYYWALAPEEVLTVSGLVQYVGINYLLLLWLIGLFTLIVGMLHLFGFNLPAPMGRLFLAASFTEFWRRANVYWKDFMQKVFFYPAFSKLRQYGLTGGLVAAIAIVFVATWFMHAYQWFWIRGTFLFTAPDILFWVIIGISVIANALYENKYGRRRALGKTTLSLAGTVVRALRSMGLFIFVGLLWSLWTSTSLPDFFALWSNPSYTLSEVLGVLPVFALIFAVFWVGTFLFERKSQAGAEANAASPFLKLTFASAACLLFLYSFSSPAVLSVFDSSTQDLLRDMQTARLNRHEAELLTRGYYENLNAANTFNSQMVELDMKKPDDWPPLRETPAGRVTGDFLKDEIVPSQRIMFHGSRLSTNRWGMRDKEYELEKPPGTFRAALLGASQAFGSGVADDETFEWLVEEKLNEAANGGKFQHYEILNFASPGYSPLQELVVFEKKVLPFKPDAIFYIATPREDISSARHLAAMAIQGVAMPYDYLSQVVKSAEIDSQMTENEAMKRLKSYRDGVVKWLYEQYAQLCEENNIHFIYIYTPVVHKMEKNEEREAEFFKLAEQNGFSVLDISDAYDNHDRDSLRVAEWDWHPNELGHKLVADRLYRALQEQPELLGLETKKSSLNQ